MLRFNIVPYLLEFCTFNMLFSLSVPMDLDVKTKAVMLGACFLIVRRGLLSFYLEMILDHFGEGLFTPSASYVTKLLGFSFILSDLVPEPPTVFSQSQPSTDSGKYRRGSSGRCIRLYS